MRMSVPVLLCCVIAGVTSTASAQVSGGVKIGANFSNLNFDSPDVPNFDRRTGLVAGVFVTIPASRHFDIQPEVLYSQKGAKISEAGDKATIELDYVDIPVLARYTSGGPASVQVFGGPSFGLRTRARSKAEFGGTTQTQDIKNDVKSSDIGLVVGAGLESGRFTVDGRYQWGLTNINKDEFDTTKVKNRTFSVLAGVRF